MKVLSVGIIIDVVDGHNVTACFRTGELGNVFSVEEESEGIVERAVGIFVVFLTREDVLERYCRNVGVRRTLKPECDRASIKYVGSANVLLKIKISRVDRELGGFPITGLGVEISWCSTGQHDSLIGNDRNRITVGIEKERNRIYIEVFKPGSPGCIVEVSEGMPVGERTGALAKDTRCLHLLDLDPSILVHDDIDQLGSGFGFKVHCEV